LDAIRWVRDVGAVLVHIDPNGGLLAVSTSAGPSIATLRRAQALAPLNPTGVAIARELLLAKVRDQISLLDALPDSAQRRPELERGLQEIETSPDIAGALAGEIRAAAAYWQAWETLPVRIAPRCAGPRHEIPDHWRTFGQRASLLSHGPRAATNPANALLNYVYTLLSAETTIACHAVGLDPGLGIFHTDRDNHPDRAALSYDIMEAGRPPVDAYVLALLTQRTLRADDFGETPQGVCRLSIHLAAELAETTNDTWRSLVAPHVEKVAHLLSADTRRPTVASPLTHASNLAAWETRKRGQTGRSKAPRLPALPASCHDCGAELPSRRHRYCMSCRRQRWEQQADRARMNAAQVLSDLRDEGRDPRHGGQAAQLRGEKNSAHQLAVRAWTGESPDPSMFTNEILPGLRRATISQIAAASGLSQHYCSLIRLGKRVPHPRHWKTLRAVADTHQR
jgi:CRISPR-associated endonuclease Cas1